jgi:hypothetical protein
MYYYFLSQLSLTLFTSLVHNNSGLYLKEYGLFIAFFENGLLPHPYDPYAQQLKFLVLSELMDHVDGCKIFKQNLSDHPMYVPSPSTNNVILVLNLYVPYSTANH